MEAIFNDEFTREYLLIKGGQLMNIYGFSNRESYDIDFAVNTNTAKIIAKISSRIEHNLFTLLEKEGFYLFDYSIKAKPRKRNIDLPPYWGGYEISFKIISNKAKNHIFNKYSNSDKRMQIMRITSLPIGGNSTTKMKIDLSYSEYTGEAESVTLNNNEITIQAYRPLILVYEKMRALCQNIPGNHPPSAKANRSRDLYDIYKLIYTDNAYSCTEMEILEKSNVEELIKVFNSKAVPYSLLLNLEKSKTNLELDFNSILIHSALDAEKITFDYLYHFTKHLMEKCYSVISSIQEG